MFLSSGICLFRSPEPITNHFSEIALVPGLVATCLGGRSIGLGDRLSKVQSRFWYLMLSLNFLICKTGISSFLTVL